MKKGLNRKKSVLKLTGHAARQIIEISEYSQQQWGASVAEKYTAEIQSALDLIVEHSEKLIGVEGFSDHFVYTRVNNIS